MLGSQSAHLHEILVICTRRSQPVSRSAIFPASPITFNVSKVPDLGVVGAYEQLLLSPFWKNLTLIDIKERFTGQNTG